ncbi:hypothetical protein Droror1_Dr00001847 [Drosera rotundifolia]
MILSLRTFLIKALSKVNGSKENRAKRFATGPKANRASGFRGKPPKGERTDWVMHEYRLDDHVLAGGGVIQDTYVICKVYCKSGFGPKNGGQYGAPFASALDKFEAFTSFNGPDFYGLPRSTSTIKLSRTPWKSLVRQPNKSPNTTATTKFAATVAAAQHQSTKTITPPLPASSSPPRDAVAAQKHRRAQRSRCLPSLAAACCRRPRYCRVPPHPSLRSS